MAGMVAYKDTTSELVMREMILGVLKAKDKNHCNIIHSSDFRSAVTDLGFSMGSSIVQNILIHCKLDKNGNLDFSELENQLSRERKLANANVKHYASNPPSSIGTNTKPWRADVVHNAKMEAEKQLLNINEHHKEIKAIFAALSFHEIPSSEALNQLSRLGINCTNAIQQVLKRVEYADVNFTEFIKLLTSYNIDQSDLDQQAIPAGGFTRRNEEHSEQVGLRKKRAPAGSKETAFYESGFNDTKQRTVKKLNTPYNGSGKSVNIIHDRRVFKSNAVRDILHEDVSGEAGIVPLLSHAQQEMAVGKLGKVVSGVDRVKFNIERKLQREQVFAALRKLDAGEMTIEDFQDVLYSIGVDLPEALNAQLSHAVVAGNIDLRRFIKLLDAALFKEQALEDIVHTPDSLELVDRFRDMLVGMRGTDFGSTSLFIKLTEVFRSMDADQDGKLTFQEFRDACQVMGMLRRGNLTEEDVHNLFHAFDMQGFGAINLVRFLQVLTYQSRGDTYQQHYTPQRMAVVRQAFNQLTRTTADASLKVEDIVDRMDLDQHPAIVCDRSPHPPSTKESVYDMLQFFTYYIKIRETAYPDTPTAYDLTLDFDVFEAYFKALSAGIEDSEDSNSDPFVAAMRNCFNLHPEKHPAPPIFTVRKASKNGLMQGHDEQIAPRALQHHGDCIAWRQNDDGLLEVEEKKLHEKQGRKVRISCIYDMNF
jgi:Ca2+-binding EF-hand superfamily protein